MKAFIYLYVLFVVLCCSCDKESTEKLPDDVSVTLFVKNSSDFIS